MQRSDRESLRNWRFETYEERLALTAQTIADFWLEYDAQLVEPTAAIAPFAAEGHGWTEVAQAREQFGLRGGNQTVAIIDSGIAYDHVALGGGLGKAHRVVGGWDFAENDANPYDDGPAGFHGTHVAGIVGAKDSKYAGLAPNVDLVALRVFDDQGSGQFAWVEQALAWVHLHRNDFANPITTVNLSLGTAWNASTLPQWATFEDELRQLAADGIFVSVAAGNSFLTYNAPGLSYPAVSPHVTPVASVDASGNMSRFSQRDSRVLAAPGEKIMSTLPDHFYGGDGAKNDWGAASGTSMAAPYVAGASVLVREAMQALGITQITQGTIYDLFRRTADTIFDSVTSASYARLNLQRALDTLVGADEFGGSAAGASSVGRLSGTLQVSGTIGRVSDQDFFQFTADKSGTATLSLEGSQQLGARWQGAAGARMEGGKLVLDVVAGQSYVVGVAGGGTSIGKYSVQMQLTASPDPVPSAQDWGTIEQVTKNDVAVSGGEQWFQVTASRSGRLTVEALFNQAKGNVDVEVYNADRQRLAVGQSAAGGERADVEGVAGQKFLIRVRGGNSDVDFRLTNLVQVNGNAAAIFGTAGNDAIQWQGGARQQLTVNGVEYVLNGVTQVAIDGLGGKDAVMLVGSSAAETATLRPGSVEFAGPGYRVTGVHLENVQVLGGGAGDTAVLYDSAGNDVLTASPGMTVLKGSGYLSDVRGFEQVIVRATGGHDTATLRDSRGLDQFDAAPNYAWLRGAGYSIRAEGFDYVTALSSSGGDQARLIGSDGNDVLTIFAGIRDMATGSSRISTQGFQRVDFDGRGGRDTIDFYAAGGMSRLVGKAGANVLTEAAFATYFTGAENVLANVRKGQTLETELAALDFVFKKIGQS